MSKRTLTFEVKVTRKVQTQPYESLEVGLNEQYIKGEISAEQAFKDLSAKVDRLLVKELEILGIERVI